MSFFPGEHEFTCVALVIVINQILFYSQKGSGLDNEK